MVLQQKVIGQPRRGIAIFGETFIPDNNKMFGFPIKPMAEKYHLYTNCFSSQVFKLSALLSVCFKLSKTFNLSSFYGQSVLFIQIQALMSEVKILSHLGSHPNILNLLGAITSTLGSGKSILTQELSGNGCLKIF